MMETIRTRRVGFTASGGPTFSVLKEGYLVKHVHEEQKSARFQRGLGLDRRRRYYMLTEASLLYFLRPPPDLALLPRAEGDLPLSRIEACSAVEGSASITIDVPQKRFSLRAPSAASAVLWVDAINTARSSAPRKAASAVSPASSKIANRRGSGKFLPSRRPRGRRASPEGEGGAAEQWWKTSGFAPHIDEMAPQCRLCTKGFSALRWRCFCAICGEAHCDRCSSHAIQRKRVCSTCFVAAVKMGAEMAPAGPGASAEASQAEAERNGPLGKYVRMEGVGVPLHGILQAMKRDGVARDAAHGFAQRRGEAGVSAFEAIFSANASDAAADGAKAQSGAGGAGNGKVVKRKTQPLYWTALPSTSLETPAGEASPHHVASRSLWRRSDDDALAGRRKVTVLQHEQIELETLFRLRTQSPPAHKAKATAKAQAGPVTLVDGKRAQNVQIALRRFKCSLPELLHSIAAVILEAASEAPGTATSSQLRVIDLDLPLLQVLEVCMPLPEEAKLLARYTGDLSRLRRAEEWLKRAFAAERTTEKLHMAIWWRSFRAQYHRAEERCLLVAHAAAQVQRSDRLARVLEVVLAVGNALNQHTRLGNAAGFDINSLLTLSHTRAVDNQTSLLRYIVRMLRARGEHEILDLAEHMPDLAGGSRLEEAPCAADVAFLAEKVRRCAREVERFDRDEQAREAQEMGAEEDGMRKLLREEAEAETQRLAALAAGSDAEAAARGKEHEGAERKDADAEQRKAARGGTAMQEAVARAAKVQRMAVQSNQAAAAAREAAEASEVSADPPRPAFPPRNMLIAAIAQAGTQAARKRAEKKEASAAAPKRAGLPTPASLFPSAHVKWQWRVRAGKFVADMQARMAELEEVRTLMHENCTRLAEYVCERYTAEAPARILRTLLAFTSAVEEAKKLEERRDERLLEQGDARLGPGDVGMGGLYVGQRVLTLYGPGIVEAKLRPRTVVVWLSFGRAFLQPDAIAHVGCVIEVPYWGAATVTHVRSKEDFVLEAVRHWAGPQAKEAAGLAHIFQPVVFVHPDRARMVCRRPPVEPELDGEDGFLDALETPRPARAGIQEMLLAEELGAAMSGTEELQDAVPLLSLEHAPSESSANLRPRLRRANPPGPASPCVSAVSVITGSPASAFSLDKDKPSPDCVSQEPARAPPPEASPVSTTPRVPPNGNRRKKINARTMARRDHARGPPTMSLVLGSFDTSGEASLNLSKSSTARGARSLRHPLRRASAVNERRTLALTLGRRASTSRCGSASRYGVSSTRSLRSTGQSELYDLVHSEIARISDDGASMTTSAEDLLQAKPAARERRWPPRPTGLASSPLPTTSERDRHLVVEVALPVDSPKSPAESPEQPRAKQRHNRRSLLRPTFPAKPPLLDVTLPRESSESPDAEEKAKNATKRSQRKRTLLRPNFPPKLSGVPVASVTLGSGESLPSQSDHAAGVPVSSQDVPPPEAKRVRPPLPRFLSMETDGDGSSRVLRAPTFDMMDSEEASPQSGVEAGLPQEDSPSLGHRMAKAVRSLSAQMSLFVGLSGSADSDDGEEKEEAAVVAEDAEWEQKGDGGKHGGLHKLASWRSLRGFRVTREARSSDGASSLSREDLEAWDAAWDEEPDAHGADADDEIA